MTGWVVTVTVTNDTDPEQLDDFLDLLGPLHGSVSGDERGWSATVTVDGNESGEAAVGQAIVEVKTYAERCSLPVYPVTRLEVVREDIRDAELERPQLPELVSGAEAAQILGVSRQRVHQLAADHPDFPEPAYRLGVGSLWFRSGVEGFAQRWKRKPGRPAKAGLVPE